MSEGDIGKGTLKIEKREIIYAIAGFGGIAENRIAREGFALDKGRFQTLDGIKLLGATDAVKERQSAVERLGLKWYRSVDDICDDNAVDAVFIAANNLSHFPIAKKSIRAGKHVIIEKPMATRLEDARVLVELAAEMDVSIAVDHMMLHNAYNIKAKQLISDGELAEINDIVLHMEFPYGYTSEEASQWRNANPDEIGGPIGDVASHCLYMAEFLLDEPITTLQAVYTPEVNRLSVESGAFIRFKTAKQKRGSIRVSFGDRRGVWQSVISNLGYEIYGSRKTIRSYGTLFQLSGHADEPVRLRLEVDDFQNVTRVDIAEAKNIYQQVVINHAESIRRGKRMTGEEGVHNLKLILLAHSSAKQNGKEILV